MNSTPADPPANRVSSTTRAHIVTIRREGVIEGHQLRIDGGGVGRSKFFGTSKYGSADKARLAAQRVAKDMGLPKPLPRGGSETGRLLRTSATGVAGIRFEWSLRAAGPMLRVVATWVDRRGRSCHTSYSVDRNGLDTALDMAIAARTSCGAAAPDRAALRKLLRCEFAIQGGDRH